MLLWQAGQWEAAAVLAAVDQDKRLATRASGGRGYTLLHEGARGNTLLHKASEFGLVELAGGLLDRGASLSAKDGNGWEALFLACAYDRLAVAALLLDRGADPNTSGVSLTALGRAASYDYLDVCLLLLSRSADLMAQMPDDGRIALELYDELKHAPLRPAELAARRAALVAAWE